MFEIVNIADFETLNYFRIDFKFNLRGRKNTKFPHNNLENEKFSPTREIFREITSILTYLVKTLISRNFCQNYVGMNFRKIYNSPLEIRFHEFFFLLFQKK